MGKLNSGFLNAEEDSDGSAKKKEEADKIVMQLMSKLPKLFDHPDNQNQFQHIIFIGIEG